MADPVKKKTERNIFNEIDLDIMLINERIRNHRRSIEKVKKMSGWNGPGEVSGIDYSREPAAGVYISFAEGIRMIELDERRIRELEEDRKELRKSKKRIEKIYQNLTGYESQAYYYRIIRKMTQAEAAGKMAVSIRHLQRIESEMKERGLF